MYRYRQIAEAGFNFVIGGNGVSNDAENARALKAASANGLRFLLMDGRLRRALRESVAASGPAPRSTPKPREEDTSYSAAGTTEDEVRL